VVLRGGYWGHIPFSGLKVAQKNHAAATGSAAHHVPNMALKTESYQRLRKDLLWNIGNSDISI
jgi:hypothetical protein